MKASCGLIGLLGIVLVACGALATPTPTPVRYDDLAAAYLAGVYGPVGHPTTGTNVAFALAKRFKQQQNLSDVEAYLKALEIVYTKFVLGVASAFGADPPGLTAEQVRRARFLAVERQPEGMTETLRQVLREQDPSYDVAPEGSRRVYERYYPAAAATYRLLGGPFMLSNLGQPVKMSFREFLDSSEAFGVPTEELLRRFDRALDRVGGRATTEPAPPPTNVYVESFTPGEIQQKLSDISPLAKSLQKKFGVGEFSLDVTTPAAEVYLVHTYTTRNLLNTPESRIWGRYSGGLEANETAFRDAVEPFLRNISPALRDAFARSAQERYNRMRMAADGKDFIEQLREMGGRFFDFYTKAKVKSTWTLSPTLRVSPWH